ncbi:hypothetical protein B296_00005591 [Ensete ventricosum]|uniref:Uncharacterized protein n=1 Tax=Ensete ventricosum TaxID=4639 RepID=A0A427BBJ8_ENSVE|nr:hypothetical protein B296_00005591 [Ensete ventricosum]
MHPTGSEDNRAAGPTWTPGFSQPGAGMTASAHRNPPASRFVRDQMLPPVPGAAVSIHQPPPGTRELLAPCRKSGSSSYWLRSMSVVTDGFSRALARKFNLNSLASWSKDEIEKCLNQLYHIRTWPQRVMGKARYIRTSDMSYKGILARKAITCFVESELSS